MPLSGTLNLELCAPACKSMPYYLGFSLGAETGLPLGTRTLPLNGDALFALSFGHPAFAGALDAGGKRSLAYRIPNDPSLSGMVFYSAFVAVDLNAPCWVRTISNPEKIEVL